ncbi:hypothetical protein ACW9KT_08005 [Hymenobacter sp. HD11105]|jgi:hypothetical protein
MLIDKITLLLLSASLLISCGDQPQGFQASGTIDTKVSATPEESPCHKGIARAKVDTKEGIIGYYFWGESIPFYVDTLQKKYSISTYIQGCSVSQDDEASWICYNHFMDSVILAKYHMNIIDQEERKSEEWVRALLAKRKRGAY